MNLQGRCHCGQLHYELEWPDGAERIPARRCGCGYCSRFAGTWTSHPGAALKLFTSGSESSTSYRFGTETADFMICTTCGVVVAALCEIAGELKAVLNIATLDEVESLKFDAGDSDFDGESREQRMDRRASRWIGNVLVQ